MLFTKAALTISGLILLVAAQDSEEAFLKSLKPSFSKKPTTTTNTLLKSRDLNKRCTGSCEECFGTGYTLCPGSSIYCYLPGDDYYGLDSCTSDSSSSDSTSTADAPSSTSTSSGTDVLCYQTGATCTSCFGPTYLDCPDGYHCYDPNDPLYDTCPDDDDTTSGGSSSATCAETYGSGSVPCGSDSCYNPGDGDVCCQDGYHCEGGYTCSTTVGKCCAPGSTSSGCSGGGSGLLSSSTLGYTRTTSSSGLTFNTATATSTSSGGSSTGVSQFANGAGIVDVQKGLFLAAGLGALVL